MPEKEIKATDLLIDLIASVEELKRQVSSQDLLMKSLVSSIQNFIENNEKLDKQEKKSYPAQPKMSAASEPIIKVPVQPTFVEKPKQVEPELKTKVNEPTQEFQQVDEQKYTISQRVIDINGKALYLAAVEVSDLNKKEKIARVTTLANGKYKVKLPIGSYRFKVIKQITMNSQRIESTQDITVVGDVELPDFVLK